MDTKALRQKVLDLAIHGKLVPQDPNDEPASVLLERIRQQKQQMVKDGKLKAKDIKNDTIIFVGEDNLHYEKFANGSVKCIENEIPFELPEGWTWCNLSMIGQTNIGLTYKPTDKSTSGIMVLRSSNIVDGQIDLQDLVRVDCQIRENQYVQENDILICVRNGSKALVGKCAVIPDLHEQASFGAFMAVYRTVFYRYIYYFLNSDFFREVFADGNSTAINQLTQDMIRKAVVPFPPISEQARICDALDKILYLVTQINTNKNVCADLITIAKSKILDLAISGQLVPQDPADEPASVLLERIRAEKEELIKQGKLKRDKKESVIFRGEDNSYYEKIDEKVSEYDIDELPYGWSIGSFSQVNMFISETVDPSNSTDEMFELYSVPNFDVGVPEIIIGKEIGSSKQSVCENDVLVCKINPRINRVWITGHITSYRILGSSEWIVFRNNMLFAPYLRHYFSSPHFRKLMLSNVSGVGGSLMRAQPESVKKYPVLIPPYQEQIRIAERIDELFALLVAIEKSLM